MMIFRQLLDYETNTFTYLIADSSTKEAVLIDSVKEKVDRDMQLLSELGLKLRYVLDTHIHADHITGAGTLRELTGAKTVAGDYEELTCVDIKLKDGDTLRVGGIVIETISTPGHTSHCLSFLVNNKLFTGDALFVRGTGRTDFQGGSTKKLFNSIHNKLFTLADDTEVYPAHDYNGFNMTTIAEEKNFNPRVKLGLNQEEFVQIMDSIKRSPPKNIHMAVPANQQCGKELQRN